MFSRSLSDLSIKVRVAVGWGHDARSGPRWRTLSRTYHMALFCLAAYSYLFCIKNNNRRLVEKRFQEAVDTCYGFSQPLGVSNNAPFATQILEILLTIDHVFVLSLGVCEMKLPKSFAGRATCIVGTKVDACAPKEFVRGLNDADERTRDGERIVVTHDRSRIASGSAARCAASLRARKTR